MSTAAAWTGETVRPSDLEQLGSAVFFSTEQFEESGQTQTLLSLNSMFRHVVTSFGFHRYRQYGLDDRCDRPGFIGSLGG